MIRLENWYIDFTSQTAYGNVYNDEKGLFLDGTSIRTSLISIFDCVDGIVKTRNSVYQLGKVSDDFLLAISEIVDDEVPFIDFLNATFSADVGSKILDLFKSVKYYIDTQFNKGFTDN